MPLRQHGANPNDLIDDAGGCVVIAMGLRPGPKVQERVEHCFACSLWVLGYGSVSPSVTAIIVR